MRERGAADWSRLDNAAKIFPPTSSKRDCKVFRFSCELAEEVAPDLLQAALERTLEAFPLYRSVLRKGLFWYYLEDSALKPRVRPEEGPPCGPIYDRDRRSLLFSVTYYRRRVNLEVFHALTDGTGALQFLRVLVYHYLAARHGSDFPEGLPPMDYDASLTERRADSFQKYYTGKKRARMEKAPRAYQIRAARLPVGRMRVIEGIMPVSAVLEAAHAHNATMTAFLSAVLLCAVHDEMPVRREWERVVLMVPVNLRKYFQSESARNFFSILRVGHCFATDGRSLQEVADGVSRSFARELTAERLGERMNELAALEHNVFARLVPLALKDLGLGVANRLSKRAVTASVSNIGRIVMPAPLIKYITQFDVFTSTDRLGMCMCSYEGRLVLSFTSAFVETDIIKRFFRTLSGLGIDIKIVSNRPDGE